MGWIFGAGTTGMLYAGGLLLVVMYVYLWFSNPKMAIEATIGLSKVVVFIVSLIGKILYAIAKFIGRLFGGRR